MDAVEFLKERRRMCNAQDGCSVCPINTLCEDYFVNLNYSQEKANGMVTIVEQWTKEHPVKTRQSEFLKMFQNAATDSDGVSMISPCYIENVACVDGGGRAACDKCRRDYWLQEVE